MMASTKETIKLPIINISQFTEEVGKQMLDAAAKFGFLYIDTAGTDFSEEIVDREFAYSKFLFESPISEKSACKIDHTNAGWTGMHNEILDPKHQRQGDFKEAFNMREFQAKTGQPSQPMPKIFQDKTSDLYEFERYCKKTCHRILDLLALGLEIKEKNFFSSRHTQPSGCVVRLLYYPAIPEDSDYNPEVDIRAGAHSDYGSMTLLFQRPSQPGLEIRAPDNSWAPVAVIPEGYTTSKTLPPILVNVGDLLSYWTNGLLKSTVHRVIVPQEARKGGEDRYSIAFFCHPAHSTTLVPIPSRLVQERKLVEGEEVGYGGGATDKRAITASEHLENRLTATYGFRMNSAIPVDNKA